jgi:hypothetical protein
MLYVILSCCKKNLYNTLIDFDFDLNEVITMHLPTWAKIV